MPNFSARSQLQLGTCDERLQRLFNEVIKHWDCTIVEGHRSIEQQRENVRKGVSKTMNSKHLYNPSRAVDVVPYPIRWGDTNRFYAFAGFVIGTAVQMGIPVWWGGDWDGDREFTDQNFHDLPHFELRGVE